jgi:hypothetical protein
MELVSLHKRVIGLGIHQAQITACAIIEGVDGETRVERCQFGAFKRDRRALAEWAQTLEPDLVDMTIFASADRLASWVGICPGNNESAGKRKSGRIRQGNPYVRRLLCEFAHAARRTASVFKSKFQALCIRRGYKRAIIAIGHKILRTIFYMLARATHFRDSTVDYEALSVARNAPRWIKSLKRFGFLPDPV